MAASCMILRENIYRLTAITIKKTLGLLCLLVGPHNMDKNCLEHSNVVIIIKNIHTFRWLAHVSFLKACHKRYKRADAEMEFVSSMSKSAACFRVKCG